MSTTPTDERAAVVAYLRREAMDDRLRGDRDAWVALRSAALHIERGDHLRTDTLPDPTLAIRTEPSTGRVASAYEAVTVARAALDAHDLSELDALANRARGVPPVSPVTLDPNPNAGAE